MIRAARVLRLIGWLALAGSVAAAPDFRQVGFSTLNALGDNGTTGGGDVPPIVVRNAIELQSAVERSDIKDKEMRQRTPRVVLIAGDIDLGELKNTRGGETLTDIGTVRVASYTTIAAEGSGGATIDHGIFDIHGAHNVIVRNIAFRDLWELDPTGKYDKLGWDDLRITRGTGTNFSHHVWIDHCDFGKAYDGQLDIVHGSDLVTVSWCRFGGDERGPQKKVSLVGHSPNNAAEDKGRLNVTFHHNWYEQIDDRAPRVRFGNVHSFNNYINGAVNATISVCDATTLVERNVYNDVEIATSFSHANDREDKDRGGRITIVDSVNSNPRKMPESKSAAVQFEQAHNFLSNVERDQLEFSSPADFEWGDRKQLPYAYTPDAVGDVVGIVKRFAGVGKVDAGK